MLRKRAAFGDTLIYMPYVRRAAYEDNLKIENRGMTASLRPISAYQTASRAGNGPEVRLKALYRRFRFHAACCIGRYRNKPSRDITWQWLSAR